MFPKLSFEGVKRLTAQSIPLRRGVGSFAASLGVALLLVVASCVSEQSPTAARPTPSSLSESSSPADDAASKADQAAAKRGTTN